MRTLNFIVDGQTLTQDPECDFSGLVPGTENYLMAHFNFSSEWGNFIKVVGFFGGTQEYLPTILDENNTCLIPKEATDRKVFSIQVLGKSGTSKLKTNKVAVRQYGGKS